MLLPSPGEPGKGWNCCEHPRPPTAILPGVPPAAYGRLSPVSDAVSVLSERGWKIIHDLSHAFLPRRGAMGRGQHLLFCVRMFHPDSAGEATEESFTDLFSPTKPTLSCPVAVCLPSQSPNLSVCRKREPEPFGQDNPSSDLRSLLPRGTHGKQTH